MLPALADRGVAARPGSVPLSLWRERFCRAYVDGEFNATQALKDSGYTGRFANRIAWRWMREQKVRDRVAYLSEELLQAVGVNAFRIVREGARLAFNDITAVRIAHDRKSLDPSLPADVTAAIKTVKFDKDTGLITHVEMHPKQPALEMLAKYRSLYPSESAGTSADNPLHIVIRKE